MNSQGHNRGVEAWSNLDSSGEAQGSIQRFLNGTRESTVDDVCLMLAVKHPQLRRLPRDELRKRVSRLLTAMSRSKRVRHNIPKDTWYSPYRTVEADVGSKDNVFTNPYSVHTTSGGLPTLGKRR